jgi:hypothetical protein
MNKKTAQFLLICCLALAVPNGLFGQVKRIKKHDSTTTLDSTETVGSKRTNGRKQTPIGKAKKNSIGTITTDILSARMGLEWGRKLNRTFNGALYAGAVFNPFPGMGGVSLWETGYDYLTDEKSGIYTGVKLKMDFREGTLSDGLGIGTGLQYLYANDSQNTQLHQWSVPLYFWGHHQLTQTLYVDFSTGAELRKTEYRFSDETDEPRDNTFLFPTLFFRSGIHYLF